MTGSLWLDAKPSLANPLDLAEQVLTDRDWAYDRSAEAQEIIADTAGSWCDYRVWLNWHEAFGALTFSCAIDTKVPATMEAKIFPLLAKVNEKMWLGHFDLAGDMIVFRYSMLLKGVSGVSLQQVEDLLDIATTECERFYPAFQSVIWGGMTSDSALDMLLLDTVGEA